MEWATVETRALSEYHGLTDGELERMLAASPKYEMDRLGPLPPAE